MTTRSVVPPPIAPPTFPPARAATRGGVVARALLAAACAVGGSAPAFAYRPLITDDASVNPRGKCQVEAYQVREPGLDVLAVAPACGIGWDLELGLEFTRPSPRVDDRGGLGVQVKAAFPSLSVAGWDFGAKVSEFTLRTPTIRDEKPELWSAVGLATTSIADLLTVHVNLGAAYATEARRTVAVYGIAAMHEFGQRGFVFAELAGDNRSPAFQNVGARIWLIHERLGLDFTAGRVAGTRDATIYTIGLAYYGFGAFD
jgi:hypothetical protein